MKTITLRRVVVTGLGAVTDLGINVNSTWEGMMSGRTGIGPITAFEQDDEWTTRFAGEVKDFDYSKVADVREAKRMDRASLLGLVAAEEAAKDCGIDFASGDPDRRGVAIGSGIGGIITIEAGPPETRAIEPERRSARSPFRNSWSTPAPETCRFDTIFEGRISPPRPPAPPGVTRLVRPFS